MGKVQEWEEVGIWLEVPSTKLDEIEEQSSTEIEKSHQVGRYWVNTHPDPSWEKLGRVLYESREETAAIIVKQYLPPQGMWIPEIRLVLVSYKIRSQGSLAPPLQKLKLLMYNCVLIIQP